MDIMNRYGKILPVLAILLAAGAAQAQIQDFQFHWAPSAVVDAQGNSHPEAVEYEIYLSRDGGFDELVGTVVGDTTFTLAAAPGIIHRIRVAGIDASGKMSPKSEWSDPVYFEETRDDNSIPGAAGLQQNYPNPFNPETRLVYGIPADIASSDRVQLDIFSLDGRLVRTMDIDRTPGWHEVVWDGTDERGRVTATGMYVTRLVVGSSIESQKMTMVK